MQFTATISDKSGHAFRLCAGKSARVTATTAQGAIETRVWHDSRSGRDHFVVSQVNGDVRQVIAHGFVGVQS